MHSVLLCRIVAVAMAAAFVGGCGRGHRESAPTQAPAQQTVQPGSGATPTNDASFTLMAQDAPTRLATLQQVIVQEGNHCAAATRGVLMGGLDGTDEWRVDCTDSGSWQVWFSNDSGTSVNHCTNAQCT